MRMEDFPSSWELPVHSLRQHFEKRNDAALVIPVWNEGTRLLEQLRGLRDFLGSVDVILADGESSDGSTSARNLESLGVRACLSTPEKGLGTALRLGLAFALQEGYDKILTVDGNGKDGMDAIPRFLEALDTFDFVQGSRFLSGGESANLPLERQAGIRFLIRPLIARASGFSYSDPSNGFKGMRRRALLHPDLQPFRRELSRFNFQFYLNCRLPRLGMKTTEIAVVRRYPRGATPSKIRGIGPRVRLVTELFATCLGRYNPKRLSLPLGSAIKDACAP